MIKPIYVVMEKLDDEWVPAIGGGYSTKSSIRAFDMNSNLPKRRYW